jgi:hypothetical protein
MTATTKICARCKEHKPLNAFYSRINKKRMQATPYCKQCHNTYTTTRFRARKKQAVAYLGGRCVACQGVFPYYVYDFHHRDPTKKDVQFNKLRRRSWEAIRAELDKCDLLCANCHRARHWEGFDGEPDVIP